MHSHLPRLYYAVLAHQILPSVDKGTHGFAPQICFSDVCSNANVYDQIARILSLAEESNFISNLSITGIQLSLEISIAPILDILVYLKFNFYLDLLLIIIHGRRFVKIILLNLFLSCDNVVSVREELHLRGDILSR